MRWGGGGEVLEWPYTVGGGGRAPQTPPPPNQLPPAPVNETRICGGGSPDVRWLSAAGACHAKMSFSLFRREGAAYPPTQIPHMAPHRP